MVLLFLFQITANQYQSLLCGTGYKILITTLSNKAWIIFNSDHTINRFGFNMTFVQITSGEGKAIYLSIYLSVYLSIYLSIYLFSREAAISRLDLSEFSMCIVGYNQNRPISLTLVEYVKQDHMYFLIRWYSASGGSKFHSDFLSIS